MKKTMTIFAAAVLSLGVACAAAVPQRVLELPPGKGNPRNSEGDFAVLKNGDILFVYTQYYGDSMLDHAPAHLVSRVSKDGGKTWSKESVEVIANEGGQNVMSVSFLRLKKGSLAMFYLRKNSDKDCRPVMRVSKDEGKTWGEPVKCVPDAEAEYYVLNNGRATRLKSGRIVLPLARHTLENGKKTDWDGELVCYYSDDEGKTWKRGSSFATHDEKGKRVTTQEPGLVELKGGRVLMYSRTNHGRQWFHYSSDGCKTWTKGEPGSLWGPCAPATIKRLKNGDLLAVWNDHEGRPDFAAMNLAVSPRGLRVPLTLAVSKDEGKTWSQRRALEGAPGGMFCYIAVCETKKDLLLGYISRGLTHLRLTTVPLAWVYEKVPPHKPQPVFSAFRQLRRGALLKVETALGTWTAETNHAEIAVSNMRYPTGEGVKFLKGENREVLLTLPKSAPSDAFTLLMDRGWSQTMRVEARQTDGTWQKVFEMDRKSDRTRGLRPIDFKKLDKPVTAYRFRVSSPWGVTVTDVDEFKNLGAFFKD